MDQGKYDLLMAQLSHKRQLKEQYLRQSRETASPLAEKLTANIALRSIRERVDVFSVEPNTWDDPLSGVLDWLSRISQCLGCGIYELFVEDQARDRAIVHRLLEELQGFEDFVFTEDGFYLPGFGYSPEARARLCFQKNDQGYYLSLNPGVSGFFPEQIPLWQEPQGQLQTFMEDVLAPNPLLEQLDTLKHLISLLEELPEANIAPILVKTAKALEEIQGQRRQAYEAHRTEAGKGSLLLLGGAVAELRKLSEHPKKPQETLKEVIYMVERANDPL